MSIVKTDEGRWFDTELGRNITYRGDKNHPFFKQALYEANKQRYNRLKSQGLCKECMAPVATLGDINCLQCRQRASEKTKIRNFKLKVSVFEAYGGVKCNCCGEANIKFLTMDHINNDGNVHRQSNPEAGPGLYRWIAKNNYPEGFQVLCWNCNLGKAHNNGVCPHNE